jgi:hypothetical protein
MIELMINYLYVSDCVCVGYRVRPCQLANIWVWTHNHVSTNLEKDVGSLTMEYKNGTYVTERRTWSPRVS